MINFRQIHEFIFSSFRISDTGRLLGELEQENIKKIIIIKRSWIYGVFVNLILFIVLTIISVNIYFMIINISSIFILCAMTGFIIINMIFWIFSGITYMRRFHKLHKKESILTGIHDISHIKKIIAEEEVAFSKFFNQMSMNYYLFICIILVYIYYVVAYRENTVNISSIFEIFFLVLQIILLSYYRQHMIDLEMDYVIVIPSRVYFIDQIGIHKRTQSIKWVTDIRLITSSYPNFLGSFFNYGTIEIIVRSDTPAIVTNYHMRYVDNPIEKVDQINQLINKKSETP